MKLRVYLSQEQTISRTRVLVIDIYYLCLLVSVTRCHNCYNIICTDGGDICSVCKLHHKCIRCYRYLHKERYEDGKSICKACDRILLHPLKKTAFNGTIEEYEIATCDYDVDVGEFLRSNASTVTNIIQEAVLKHT